MQIDAVNLFKKCFKQISIKELNERISNFRRAVDLRTITEIRLKAELHKLFSVNLNEESVSFFIKSDTETLPHSKHHFYRIRKFSKEDYLGLENKTFVSMQQESDAWLRPPEQVTTYGRLNRPKNSILYLSYEPTNAIFETDCKINECFFLLVYENKKQMRLSQIQSTAYFEEFDELENAKIIILNNFLLSEFTRWVSSGREYLYRSSLAIYEEFFFTDLIDGFCYPSIRSESKTGFNICFSESSAKNNLSLLGVMVCQLQGPTIESEFGFNLIYDGFLSDGSFSFYGANSDIARQKYGPFAFIRDMGL